MPIRVNLAGVAAAEGFEALPRGKYRAFVYESKETETSKGDPMWMLVLKVSEDHPDEQYHGRQAWLNHPVMEKTKPFIKTSLIALGEDPSELDTDLEFDPADYEGREVVFQCSAPREYDGEKRTQVSRLWPADTPVEDESGDETLSVDELPL